MSNNITTKRRVETELSKALTTSGDGAALLPYDLDPMLHENLLALQPLFELLEVGQADGKTHEWTVRTSHPQAWFEGESTPANSKNSVYARKSVQTKIQRIWGSVTGYSKAATAKFVDNFAKELVGSLEGMANVTEFGTMWGTSTDAGFTGDAYQFTGIIPFIFQNAVANVIDAGSDKIALGDLDNAYAAATGFRGVVGDPKLWAMSLKMRQVVDGLQLAVSLPLTSAELMDGKITMREYGNIPIFESDYFVPPTSSPTVSAAAGSGSGTLATATYYYKMSSITVRGEAIVGVEDSQAITGPDDVDLTWTPDPAAVLYMIWRSTSTNTETLLDIIPALTYDAAGTVNGTVAAYHDDGSRTLKAVKPLLTGEQNILLVNRNPERGASYVGLIDDFGDPVASLVNFVDLARTKDTLDYMLKGYYAMKLVHANLFALIRHAKLA